MTRTTTRLGLALGLVFVAGAPATAQLAPDTLEIYAVHGSAAELDVVAQLRDVAARHDLRDWEVTPVVRIDETQIPHSHPALTIHTRHRNDPDGLLAVYLHEQFHWWVGVGDRRVALDAAMADLRAAFPDAPTSGPEGARGEYSTYLHLVVCHLEYQAVRATIGEERARAALLANRHYTWIYRTVLDDPRVTAILELHGFVVE